MTHVWKRELWSDDAEKHLGSLIESQRDRHLHEIETGIAHLYRVSGPLYGGFFLVRFHETAAGLECHCIAFNGHNTDAGLRDLREVAKRAGCVALTCFTQQEAVARLYRKQGWEIVEYFLRINLNE